MSSLKKGSSRRFDDMMDDDSDDKDSKRKSRNLSEKKRRDQFNLLVSELSSMVSTGCRKMDKSTVLKSTISFLKNHNEITVRSRINEIQEDWKPTFLTNEEFTHLVLEAVDGFIMVFSTTGHIYYASESIASLLGHLPGDVASTTIFELASEDEQTNLYNILLNPSEEEKQVVFSCHLRRGGPGPNSTPIYELVHFVGYFRSDEDMIQSENRYSGYSGEADTRLVFVGTGRIQTPQLIKEMPLVDSVKSEFTSRHSLEWKFLFLDHRAPPIIGYLPFELLGTSGYDYYHVDDLGKVVSCHESLMQKGEGTSCYYRFLTKGQQWIWLQTRFYITYHQWNSKPEFIVCTHRVVSYPDVMKQSRKKDCHDGFENIEEPSSAVGGSSVALPWPGSKSGDTGGCSVVRHGPPSDCTSMSADSPGSRQSSVVTTQRSTPQPNQPTSPQIQAMQFIEPAQYVAAIPVQPLMPNYPTSDVLSPIPQVDNMVMSPVQSQLQVDLQKKHAELQAIIGQQQQELRRVSEQLLMARLGLLPGSQNQQVGTNVPISYQATNSGTVSSTTSTVIASGVPGPRQVLVPVSVPISLPLQHQQNIIYNTPDSNTQSN
ncbi:circadian locomoter output cycles kaput protein Clock isoform X1 [Leptinotarsa decemlineata]|uniref:circadian locomoter output cycles kaput protein Clock isoform X1 n=1 Tax=Leptinotarsa decemlineata TaxID=7539 RepID=UPI003D3059BF